MSTRTRTLPAPAPERVRASLVVILGGLVLIGPLSVDAYLPAFSSIEVGLHASGGMVQQTLSAYLFAFAAMSLSHGALSDAFGRRRVILLSLVLFTAASVGCAISPSMRWLWTFRVVQGLCAGVGTVVGQAIIRDVYTGAKAAKLLSIVGMIFSLSPALAPVVGGWIVTIFDWHAIFLFLAFYAALLFALCLHFLPETLPQLSRRPLLLKSFFRDYRVVSSSPAVMLAAGTVALNFYGLFLYVAATPVFLTKHLGLSRWILRGNSYP